MNMIFHYKRSILGVPSFMETLMWWNVKFIDNCRRKEQPQLESATDTDVSEAMRKNEHKSALERQPLILATRTCFQQWTVANMHFDWALLDVSLNMSWYIAVLFACSTGLDIRRSILHVAAVTSSSSLAVPNHSKPSSCLCKTMSYSKPNQLFFIKANHCWLPFSVSLF